MVSGGGILIYFILLNTLVLSDKRIYPNCNTGIVIFVCIAVCIDFVIYRNYKPYL